MFDPGLQDRMLVLVLQPFKRDDRLAGEVADMRLAGTDSRSVYLDGAGAALRYPAAVFGTRNAEFVTQHPKQRHLGNYIDLVFDPIDGELDHVGIPSRCCLLTSEISGPSAAIAASATATSCSTVPALAPTAPTMLPFNVTGMPPPKMTTLPTFVSWMIPGSDRLLLAKLRDRATNSPSLPGLAFSNAIVFM